MGYISMDSLVGILRMVFRGTGREVTTMDLHNIGYIPLTKHHHAFAELSPSIPRRSYLIVTVGVPGGASRHAAVVREVPLAVSLVGARLRSTHALFLDSGRATGPCIAISIMSQSIASHVADQPHHASRCPPSPRDLPATSPQQP